MRGVPDMHDKDKPQLWGIYVLMHVDVFAFSAATDIWFVLFCYMMNCIN